MTPTLPRLFTRQRVMLALLNEFGGEANSIDFQKYLFLFTQLCEKEKSYEFVPYKFGCFSFQSYADRRKLIELEVLADSTDWQLLLDKQQVDRLVDQATHKKIKHFKQRYYNLKGDELVKEVYRQFPYYATKSEIANKLMSDSELGFIRSSCISINTPEFFTIGYEGASFEDYLNRLIKNDVALLVDVRKNPLSRKYGFSKRTLSETVEKLGIKYQHIPELGIMSDKRQTLETKRDYERLFDDYEKTTLQENQDALDKLHEIFLKHKRVAITCFEATQCMCHRGRVAKALSKRPDWTYKINHI